MKKNIVIVGAGHAAGQVMVTLRQRKYDGKITLIGEEEYYPYQRPPLSKKVLAGQLAVDRLYVNAPSFYDDPVVERHFGTTVARLDPACKTVTYACHTS